MPCVGGTQRGYIQIDRFLEKYGSAEVDVGVVPYAVTYGRKTFAAAILDMHFEKNTSFRLRMPLRQYVAEYMSKADTDKYYVFDARVVGAQPQMKGRHVLIHAYSRIRVTTAECGPHAWFNKQSVLQQFALGAADTGAPPHFHGTPR